MKNHSSTRQTQEAPGTAHFRARHRSLLLAGAALLALGNCWLPCSTAQAAELRISDIKLFDHAPYDPRADKSSIPTALQKGAIDVVTFFKSKEYFDPDKTPREVIEDAFKAKPVLYQFFPAKSPSQANSKEALIRAAIAYSKEHELSAATNYSAIRTADKLGDFIMSAIIRQILKKNGFTSESRNRQWAQAILEPFHRCTERAATVLQAKGPCIDSVVASIAQNIGLAAVHEAAHQYIVSDAENPGTLIASMDAQYRQCMGRSDDTVTVERCTKQSIRDGIVGLIRPHLAPSLASTFKNKDRLRATVKKLETTLQSCVGSALALPSVGRKNIIDCVDKLVFQAGPLAIAERLSSEKALLATYSGAELQSQIKKQQQSFLACAKEQQKKNLRTAKGSLDTAPCETRIQNDVTYGVIRRKLTQGALEALAPARGADGQPAPAAKIHAAKVQAAAATKVGLATLDRCWKREQSPEQADSCLRKSTIALASDIAARSLAPELPASFTQKFPRKKQEFVDSFESCLERKLPQSLIEADEKDIDFDECAGRLRRHVALDVAPHLLREAATEQKVPEHADALIDKWVKGTLEECLGALPTDEHITRCTLRLKRGVATDIAALRLPPEIRKVLPAVATPGDQATLERKAAAAARDIPEAFGECIRKNVTDPQGADAAVERCGKEAIGNIAYFVADLQFQMRILPLYKNDSTKAQALRARLMADLGKCIAEGAKLPTEKYIAHIEACSPSLTDRAVLMVGRDKVEDVLRRHQLATPSQQAAAGAACTGDCAKGTEDHFADLAKKAETSLEDMAKIIDATVEYDRDVARGDLNLVLAKIAQELRDSGKDAKSRERLLDFILRNTNLVNQAVKGKVRSEALAALMSRTGDDKLPEALIARVTGRQAIEAIFNTPEGRKLAEDLMSKYLKPLVLEDRSPEDPALVAAMADVERRVRDMLVVAPTFGGTLVDESIQGKIDSLPNYTRKALKYLSKLHLLYRKDALNWEKLKRTAEGQRAFLYARENLLRPVVFDQRPGVADAEAKAGRPLTEAEADTAFETEMSRRTSEAARLVQDAMKRHKK